jgi:hypothetical protein
LTVATIPTRLAQQQIAAMRGKAKASLLLAVDKIRRRGCAAAGVRLAGDELSLSADWTSTVRGGC